MTSDESIKPAKVYVEVPDKCDTCGQSERKVEPIHQKSSTSSFGSIARVVGYFCPICDTTHLYRMDAE